MRDEDGVNLDDVVQHSMRHTCLIWRFRSGMYRNIVSKWAGYANVLITEQRYVHTEAGDLLDSLASLTPPD